MKAAQHTREGIYVHLVVVWVLLSALLIGATLYELLQLPMRTWRWVRG